MKTASLRLLAFSTLLAAAGLSAAVPDEPSAIQPLLIGAEAPSATVRDSAGETHDLAALVAGQPTVLVFYRGGWCPYCNTHLADLVKADPKLRELGLRVLALSPDSPESLREAESYEDLDFTYELYSDAGAEAMKTFGIAFRVPDALFTKYRNEYGIDLEAWSGEEHHILPVPAVYIIDGDGRIAFAYVNPDYKTRITADLLLAAARMVVGS